MTVQDAVVFLVDCDNTLLDNDVVQDDLRHHLASEFGTESRDRFWVIFEQRRHDLGYADYLGALQQYRSQHPHDTRLLLISSFLLDYPFPNRLYPGALRVLDHLGQRGATVILSDGDVVFQPRKIQRSGLWDAVEGRVLITIHKEAELPLIAARYPAARYVLIDDKPRLLAAFKRQWGDRVTTVLPRQGHYALDPSTAGQFPPADLTVERIADLLDIAPTVWDGAPARGPAQRRHA